MSKHKIRHSKTCLNCGTFVENNYCPKCGQENTESRQSFHHLFTHFVSDFLHYDSSFWKTTKYLFLSPAKLSLEYMNGRRKSYVNPFTLYIFISFFAFFIPPILPDVENLKEDKELNKVKVDLNADVDMTKAFKDSLIAENKYITPEEIDSIYLSLDHEHQILATDGLIYKTLVRVAYNAQDEHRMEKATEFFIHNLPKALFFYMPIFAFFLWLFHNKKKRYYFDNGIFTLHFFSVILLSITICSILMCIFDWIGAGKLSALLWLSFIGYITFYFFRGSRIFYAEKRWISNLKSMVLFVINTIMLILITILYSLFTVYKIYG